MGIARSVTARSLRKTTSQPQRLGGLFGESLTRWVSPLAEKDGRACTTDPITLTHRVKREPKNVRLFSESGSDDGRGHWTTARPRSSQAAQAMVLLRFGDVLVPRALLLDCPPCCEERMKDRYAFLIWMCEPNE
jgi:hypothetical protein